MLLLSVRGSILACLSHISGFQSWLVWSSSPSVVSRLDVSISTYLQRDYSSLFIVEFPVSTTQEGPLLIRGYDFF
jgi:hypothetical protein